MEATKVYNGYQVTISLKEDTFTLTVFDTVRDTKFEQSVKKDQLDAHATSTPIFYLSQFPNDVLFACFSSNLNNVIQLGAGFVYVSFSFLGKSYRFDVPEVKQLDEDDDVPELVSTAQCVETIMAPIFSTKIDIDTYLKRLKTIKKLEEFKATYQHFELSHAFWKEYFEKQGLVFNPNTLAQSQFWECKIQLLLQYLDGLSLAQKCSHCDGTKIVTLNEECIECKLVNNDKRFAEELVIKDVALDAFLKTLPPTDLIYLKTHLAIIPTTIDLFLKHADVEKASLYFDKYALTVVCDGRIGFIELDRDAMYRCLLKNCGVHFHY